MDLELAGKTAIVTGGSRGIGKAIARELANEGVAVAIAARTEATLVAAAEELSQETGGTIAPLVVDTRDSGAVRQMVERAVQALGRVDILVNCAAAAGGGSAPPSLSEVTDEMVLSDINEKAVGYLRCAREVAPHMIRQGWGRIVNIGGLAARSSGAIVTSMRNVAVVALTKNLADELGPHGINVTVVHPGTTRTERTAGLIATRAKQGGISEEEVERQMAQGNSVRQIVDARHIAYVVAFLASPKSLAVNGDVIAAGGGPSRAIYY